MKRLWCIAAAAALALSAASVWAGGLCSCSSRCHCIEPPCQRCQDCSDPCCRWRMPTLCGDEHAQKLMDTLCSSCECCERIKAARKLGSRIHADFCKCPDILNALVKALMCDTCWEVRKAAAWAIASQNARVPQGVAALYIASKADRHYLVRDTAADALSILILCRNDCYKDLFKAADVLITRIRPDYNPTNGNCVNLVMGFCENADGTVIMTPKTDGMGDGKAPELVAPPKDDKKEEEKKEDKKDDDKKEDKKEDKKDDEKKEDKKEDK